MPYNAMAHKKISQWLPYKTYSTALASQITRLVSVRKSFVEDTDATYVNNPQPFHEHSMVRVPSHVQKYFRRAPGLLSSWRSELGDCPVQYGKLRRKGCEWSLQLRSVLVLHACLSRYRRTSWPVATGGRSYSPYGK